MAVSIRLQRKGRRNRVFYRIVAADSRSPRDGRNIEELGTYDPASNTGLEEVILNDERVQHWLSNGAKPSETVTSILKRRGIALPWVELAAEKAAKRVAARREAKGLPAEKAKKATTRGARARAGKEAKAGAAEVVNVDSVSKKAKRAAKKAK